LLFIATFILSFFLKFPGGLSHNYSRYVFVLLPVLICGFLGEVQKRQQISVALLLAAIFVVPLSYTSVYAYFSDVESMRTNIEDIAAWTDAHIPPNATVLVHDDGFIAYSTNLHLIDIVGLKTPSSAEFHREITAPSGGRLRGMAVCKIAKRANANYAIILNDKGSFWSPLAADLQHCGFTLTTEMRSRSSLEYVIYKIGQPEGGTRPISTVRR